jgi:hypothetical protein
MAMLAFTRQKSQVRSLSRPPAKTLAMAGAGGVLVSPDDAAIDVVAEPVQLPTSVSAAVDLGHNRSKIPWRRQR